MLKYNINKLVALKKTMLLKNPLTGVTGLIDVLCLLSRFIYMCIAHV